MDCYGHGVGGRAAGRRVALRNRGSWVTFANFFAPKVHPNCFDFVVLEQ